MNLQAFGARGAFTRQLVPEDWAAQTGSLWSLSGSVATASGSNAAGTENLRGPLLPNADCHWYVRVLAGLEASPTRVGFLGVARSDLIPASYNSPGSSTLYWSGSFYVDNSSVFGNVGALSAGLFKFAINSAANQLHLKNLTTDSPIGVMALPSGYSLALLRPFLLPQGGFRGCDVQLFKARLGSGGLF